MISFIIPALNEEENIRRTIESIHVASNAAGLAYEIIVMDHGSQDRTKDFAEEAGAKVYVSPGGSIARLRNTGSNYANGETLIFIDADVTLTPAWTTQIRSSLKPIESGEKVITGSHCSPPPSNNLLLKYWFSALATDPRNTHLGTGHMIVGKAAFKEIGGFDDKLTTGEDYEFCTRAKNQGFQIINNSALSVYHHNFPKKLGSFVKREAWHGMGDLHSIKSAMKSKVVWGSLLFLLGHLLLLLGIIATSPTLIFSSLCLIGAILLVSSLIKNAHCTPQTILINAALFYFYYLGRSLSFYKKLIAR
jgi:glycosyltransferase involved in cell wall biosynthesis